MNDLIENCNKTEDRTVKLARELTEMGQQIVLTGERMNGINQRMTELEQERSDPPSHDPIFAEIVRTTSSAQKLVYTPSSPSSAQRIKKLEFTTSEAER